MILDLRSLRRRRKVNPRRWNGSKIRKGQTDRELVKVPNESTRVSKRKQIRIVATWLQVSAHSDECCLRIQ